MNETHTGGKKARTTTTTAQIIRAQESPSFPSNQLRHQSSFHRFVVCFCSSCCVVLCSNHFCFSVNNFRYRNYVYISFTCSEHNNRTYNKTTIMKIEIKTWGSREFSISLCFSLFVCPFLPCVRSVFHIYTIQIDAQRKQWRKMRGYKIYLRILKKKLKRNQVDGKPLKSAWINRIGQR